VILTNIKLQRVLTYAGKAVALVALFALFFSPFNQILQTPVAQAALAPCTGDNAGLKGVPGVCGVQPGEAGWNLTDDSLACTPSNPSVCLASVIYAFTVGLGSGLAYVGGFMFDTTVALSLNSAAYGLTFLSEGWTAARDLANMAFILILVYIAFMIMFQAETTNTISMLAWVIFIALIINFSFFFTRVVIDTGNILAVQFYNSIQAPSLQETMNRATSQSSVVVSAASGVAAAAAPQGSLANTKDLTHSIMSALNLQQLFSNESFQSFAKQSGFGTKFIVLSFLYIMVGACYFILAAMFFAVSIKFILRVVVLWFLVIASPLAFICKAVPRKEVSDWYDKWQHELINHAFYPAFFLFIFFFISSIMSQFGGSAGILGGLATSLNAAASDPNLNGFIFIASSVATVGIRLGFVVAMLYIALKASEYMGVKGAGVAHGITNRIGGLAKYSATLPVRGAFAGTAWAGRNTVGRGSYALSRSSTVQNLAANSIFGKPIKAALGGLEKASFDIRGTSVGKNLKNYAGEAGGKGGFGKQLSERAKGIEARAKELKETDEQMVRAAQSNYEKNVYEGGKVAFDTRVEELARLKASGTSEQKKKAEKEMKDLLGAGKKQLDDEGKERIKAFAKRMGESNWRNLERPSRGSIEGAAKALKLVSEKSSEQKAVDALKDFVKESEGDATPAATSAAAAAPAGPSTPAPTSHAFNRTERSVPQINVTDKLERALNKNAEALQEATEGYKEAGGKIDRGFTGLRKTVKEVMEKNGKDTKRFERLVTSGALPTIPKSESGSRDILQRGPSGRPVASVPPRPAPAPAPLKQERSSAPMAPIPNLATPPPKPEDDEKH